MKNLAPLLSQLPDEMDLASVPGLVLATVQKSDIQVYPIGVKHAQTQAPITPDTVFPAASLSKPVFAWGVLGLVEKGLFDLDRPLMAYLPLPEAESVPQLNEITARQVLSHATGLQNWRFSLDDKFEFAFQPGTGFQYSGEGYFYLQRVIEKITGQGIEGFMQDHVLQPLGLTHSSFLWLTDYEQTLTWGHHDRGVPGEGFGARFGRKMWALAEASGKPLRDWRYEDVLQALPQIHPNLRPLGNDMLPNVAASLLTTAADYAQFVQQIMAAPPEGMLTPQISINRWLSWGLGWGLAHAPHGPTFWHWGDNGAFKNFIYADPGTREALLILTNGERGLTLCERIIRRLTGYEHPAFLWL
ncbi:MAG: beta-lactamase family protein [Anaerolineales bacterium]|nr:beta-lactamase family protein [Anaerolineales bacterium]